MNLKRRELVDALPSHDWSIAKAGITIGYSESYAKTRLTQALKDDVEFCRAVVKGGGKVRRVADQNRGTPAGPDEDVRLTAAAGGSQTTRFERFTLQASSSAGGIDWISNILFLYVPTGSFPQRSLRVA
jgi:hypothetical protein